MEKILFTQWKKVDDLSKVNKDKMGDSATLFLDR